MHLDTKLSILIREDTIPKVDVFLLAPSQLIRMPKSVCSCSSSSVQRVGPPDTPPATERWACGRLDAETKIDAKIAILRVAALYSAIGEISVADQRYSAVPACLSKVQPWCCRGTG